MASARASATRWRWPPESCAGKRFSKPRELHQIEQLERAALDLLAARAARPRTDAKAEADIVEHSHVAEQRVALEHEADIALLHGELERVLAVEQHAAGGRHVEAGEDAEQRRLAGAGRAEQGDELARADVERYAMQSRASCRSPHDSSRW